MTTQSIAVAGIAPRRRRDTAARKIPMTILGVIFLGIMIFPV